MKSGRIQKAKNVGRYTIIPNSVLEDSNLSLRSIGLLCYLLKLPPDWIVHKSKLHNQLKDGRDAVMNAFTELENAGYIICEKVRGKAGQFASFDYYVYDTPQPLTGSQEMVTGNPDTVEPLPDNTDLQSTVLTKDLKQKTKRDTPDGEGATLFDVAKEYKKIEKTGKNISEFIDQHKPDFIEPYKDAWNIFAAKRKLPEVREINDSRKRKFAIRIREKAFDFKSILARAAQSEFCLTGGWFCFDWLIENDKNYLKVLEGNYDNKSKPGADKSTNDKGHKMSETRFEVFKKELDYLQGRFNEDAINPAIIQPDYYDQLVTYDFLPVGSYQKYKGTYDEQRRAAVIGYLESKKFVAT